MDDYSFCKSGRENMPGEGSEPLGRAERPGRCKRFYMGTRWSIFCRFACSDRVCETPRRLVLSASTGEGGYGEADRAAAVRQDRLYALSRSFRVLEVSRSSTRYGWHDNDEVVVQTARSVF